MVIGKHTLPELSATQMPAPPPPPTSLTLALWGWSSSCPWDSLRASCRDPCVHPAPPRSSCNSPPTPGLLHPCPC